MYLDFTAVQKFCQLMIEKSEITVVCEKHRIRAIASLRVSLFEILCLVSSSMQLQSTRNVPVDDLYVDNTKRNCCD